MANLKVVIQQRPTVNLSSILLLFLQIPTSSTCSVNRYVDNICKNPTEEKYRKIKLSNKVFQVCSPSDV